MRRKHNTTLISFLFQITMQRKCQERKRSNKLSFFFIYFLPIKAKITKYSREIDECTIQVKKAKKQKKSFNEKAIYFCDQTQVTDCYYRDPKN